MRTPDQVYGQLFRHVQLSGLFPDSKTFVDAIPKSNPEVIMRAFDQASASSGFNLLRFVTDHFILPGTLDSGFKSDKTKPIEAHIESLWPYLRRNPDEAVEGSSLIPLPYPYIVPGGRFGEIYYWDSYFTMLGLLESGHIDDARNMLANFGYLIQTFGHIPNGNRTYYISRSQPPFYTLMLIEMISHTGDTSLYDSYGPIVELEYGFWMDESSDRRVVNLGHGEKLNRYWDDSDQPRQESYREDVELASKSNRPANELYRDIRAACESGWDFSTRWLADPDRLDSIETTSILPVDLNCLIWEMEHFLFLYYESKKDEERKKFYGDKFFQRGQLMNKYFWNEKKGIYSDYHFIDQKQTSVPSLAMMFPVFMGLASREQVQSIVEALTDFINPGGLVTTLHHSGQQWDAPNGWAPLQWIAYAGLKQYGYGDLADRIAKAWLHNVNRVYQNTGRILEKYDVEDITLLAGGGEYPVQDGFGWTNGVYLIMAG